MPSARVYEQQGFSLLELLMAITVLGILMVIAVPSYKSSMLSAQLRSATNDLVSSANFARSEALKRNAVVTLCVSASGSSCGTGDWQQGWIVGCRTTDNIVCNNAGTQWLVFFREKALPTSLKINDASSLVSLSFQPNGLGATSASFKVCRSTGGTQERVITINAVGRISVKKTTTGICS
jgi:type IV fimbrial biogenesis protein FimT